MMGTSRARLNISSHTSVIFVVVPATVSVEHVSVVQVTLTETCTAK